MARRSSYRKDKREASPLDSGGLERLALHYVGRYATTRAKLRAYLSRKLGERGWAGDRPADVEAIVATCARLGYVDDAAFATQRAASLGRRGYGARRVGEALRAAGIEADDAAPAQAASEDGAWDAALAFARRKRIGPFATSALDDAARRKALAAMLRAGHPWRLAQRLVDATPGETPESEW